MELPLAVVRATRIRTRRSCARRCRRTRHDRFRVPLPKWAPAARILLPQPGERAVSAGYNVFVAATLFPLWSGHQPDRSRVRSPYYLLHSPFCLGAQMRCGGWGDRGGALPLASLPEVGSPTVPICAAVRISCAPESRVACRAVKGVGAPRRDPVTVAVGVVAQVGPSPHHLRLAQGRTRWVDAWTVGVEAGVEPVRAPHPDVARDVVESVSV